MAEPQLRLTPRPRRSPAREVQDDIRHLERTIDEALAGGGTLLSRMLTAGSMAGLPPADGQAAIERTLACLGAGTSMRAEALAVHQQLREISGKIDLRELGWGGLVDSPSDARLAADEPTARGG